MVEQIIINTFIVCIFSLIFISINLVVGINIISRFFDYKAQIFLFVGIAWLGLSLPWIPETIKFFFLLLGAEIEALSLMVLYLIINIMAAPLFLIIWVYAMNQLTDLKDVVQRGLFYGTIVIVGLFEIMIIILGIIDPRLLLNPSKGVEVMGISLERYTVFWRFIPVSMFQIFLLVIVLFTGILFAKESLESDDLDVVLKGKFLLIAFISFTVGAGIDALFDVESLIGTVMKVIARIILMSSSVEFFMGFILPERIKKLFI